MINASTNVTLTFPPDDPAPLPDLSGGQLEGHKLPLLALPLHLWRRTLLLPPQRRQVSQPNINIQLLISKSELGHSWVVA